MVEKIGKMECKVKDREVENEEPVTEHVGEAYEQAELKTRNY